MAQKNLLHAESRLYVQMKTSICRTAHRPSVRWLQNEYDNPYTNRPFRAIVLFVRVHQIKLSVLHFYTCARSGAFLFYYSIAYHLYTAIAIIGSGRHSFRADRCGAESAGSFSPDHILKNLKPHGPHLSQGFRAPRLILRRVEAGDVRYTDKYTFCSA